MEIRSHRQRDVYNMAFEAAVEIYEVSKRFPAEEKVWISSLLRKLPLAQGRLEAPLPIAGPGERQAGACSMASEAGASEGESRSFGRRSGAALSSQRELGTETTETK